MTAVRINQPLPAAPTDADWNLDFDFQFPDADPAIDWTGSTFALAAVQRVKRGATPASFTLTSDALSLQLLAATRPCIRVAAATMATLQAQLGFYDFELRRFGDAGLIDAIAAGVCEISQGVSQLAPGDPLPGPSTGGVVSTITIITDASGVRIDAASAGPMGPRAPQELMAVFQGLTTLTDGLHAPFVYVCGPQSRTFKASKLRGTCDQAAGADALFPVTLNGTLIGHVTYPAAQIAPTADFTDAAMVEGDVLRIFGPAVPDPNLINPAIIIAEEPR